MKNLYDKNFKSLKKEIKEDIRKWKDLSCSQIGRINIVKIANLPKAIYKFIAIPQQNPAKFSTELKITVLNFIWKGKNIQNSKKILYNKGISEGITTSEIKLYFRDTVVKTAWYWQKTEMSTN